jgi:predicted DNA-binding transcriptional regulator AlpA
VLLAAGFMRRLTGFGFSALCFFALSTILPPLAIVPLMFVLTTSNATPIRTNKTGIDHIIRAKEVQSMTGLSRTTLWRMENKGEFPRRVSLGVGSVGWRHSEVQHWLANRQAV